MSFYVFTRTWWTRDKTGKWPRGLRPQAGRRHVICRGVDTIEEAREICRRWNAEHDPGPLSRKAEFDEK